MLRFACLVPFAAVSLAGCGAAIDAPSLGLRPAEAQPISLPAEGGEADTPTDPALASRIAPIVTAAEAAHARFIAARRAAAAITAKGQGAAPGSEAWVQAEAAQSTLDVERGGVREAAAAIDALRQEPANAAPGNRAAIDAAATRIEALAADEAA